MSRVPDATHYSLGYVLGGRTFSYAHQLESVGAFKPDSVIEIGPGPGIVTMALRRLGVSVTTVDVEPSVGADVQASVTTLPFSDRSFDAGMCCQVLEHIPFESFEIALRELHRTIRRALILSLPDCSRRYSVGGVFPKLGRRHFEISVRQRISDGQMKGAYQDAGHFWEIGYPGYSFKTICGQIQKCDWTITRSWRVAEIPFHRFFVLSK